MGDDADRLAAAMAGMDVREADAMSLGSSNAASELEIMRAQNRHLQSQLNTMQMTTTTLTQQLAEMSAAASPEQMKHNSIIANDAFVHAITAMPDLDIDTLWWLVQWGNEYLARFKRDNKPGSIPYKAHARYKKWTADTQQKQIAGFTASLRSRAGDDSLDQSQND